MLVCWKAGKGRRFGNAILLMNGAASGILGTYSIDIAIVSSTLLGGPSWVNGNGLKIAFMQTRKADGKEALEESRSNETQRNDGWRLSDRGKRHSCADLFH